MSEDSCPYKLISGICRQSQCSHNHNFRACDPCGLVISPESAWRAHSTSDEHQDRVKGNFVRCTVCSASFLRNNWRSHRQGERHKKEAKKRGLRPDVDPEIPASVAGFQHCKLCNLFIQDIHWSSHQRRPEHQVKEQYRRKLLDCRASVMESEDDRGGITISHRDGVDLGIQDQSAISRGVTKHIIVTSEYNTPRIKLVDIQLTQVSGNSGADTYVSFFPTRETDTHVSEQFHSSSARFS
jgi:hypothetical protein